MPRYDYVCRLNGHLFEEIQSFYAESGAACPRCGAPSDRQISIPAVHYKGSGFYTTDHARNSSRQSSSSSGKNGGDSDKPPEKAKKGSKASSTESKGSSDSSKSEAS